LLDSRLDSLRQSALMQLAHNAELDFATLRAHLAHQGFVEELANLLDSDIYVHAGFARPSAPTDQAGTGWDHTFGLCQRAELEAELKRAEMELADNPSEEAFAAYKALREQLRPADDERDEADGEAG